MPSGLVALLDDMAVIARAASASMDDVAVAAGKAGTKTAGVVIDDAAVTPSYVTGLSPARELPIIWKIAKGSLKNKLVFLLPAALSCARLPCDQSARHCAAAGGRGKPPDGKLRDCPLSGDTRRLYPARHCAG